MKSHSRNSASAMVVGTLTLFLLAACQPIRQLPEADPQPTGIVSETSSNIDATFDLVQADVRRDGNTLIFSMITAGDTGTSVPTATGALAGANVESYVWPTTLNSSAIGFAADQGILALAVTAHPDFDDTPLYDENNDGDKTNDGGLWHSHWVVLVPDDGCGTGALKVLDIAEGEKPALPATWPQLPLLIDSPDLAPMLTGKSLHVEVPVDVIQGATTFNFDGVTAGLQVNADLHAPLLCVTAVHDVASGDLSLPGKVE